MTNSFYSLILSNCFSESFLKKRSASKAAEKQTKRCKVWEERLARGVKDAYSDRYFVLGHENMVGLFSCIFVKEKYRERIRNVSIKTTKTGLKGLHGNKVKRGCTFIETLRTVVRVE
jgi:hypothetical protein